MSEFKPMVLEPGVKFEKITPDPQRVIALATVAATLIAGRYRKQDNTSETGQGYLDVAQAAQLLAEAEDFLRKIDEVAGEMKQERPTSWRDVITLADHTMAALDGY
jgi:hypothetical protein